MGVKLYISSILGKVSQDHIRGYQGPLIVTILILVLLYAYVSTKIRSGTFTYSCFSPSSAAADTNAVWGTYPDKSGDAQVSLRRFCSRYSRVDD